jgi:ankyrin repeat protein
VEYLLANGADPNLKAEEVPLRMALRNGHFMPALLKAGADPKTEPCIGILELATYYNSLDAVTALVEIGKVDINQAFPNGNRPLCTAIRDDRPDIFKYLLSKGADPNNPGPDHPLVMALRRPHFLRALAAAGADPRHEKCRGIMEVAVYYNNMETIKILAEDVKVDLNEQFENGNAALTTCVRDKRPEIMSYLLSRGADPNAPGADTLPLHWAATLEDGTMFKMLLDAGADINKRAREGGNTMLIEASLHGRAENCRMLLEKGADLNAVGSDGEGALEAAANKGWDEVIAVLVEFME